MTTQLVTPDDRIKTTNAIDAVRRKGVDTDWALYQLISKKPELSVYELAKESQWSTGKVYGSVKRLEKQGLVCLEKTLSRGRAILRVSPIRWQEFFTPEELEEFRNMEF